MKNLLNKATAAGRKANQDGKPCVCSKDPEGFALMQNASMNHDSQAVCDIMRAWWKGWNDEDENGKATS